MEQVEEILNSLQDPQLFKAFKKIDTLCQFNSTDLEIKLGMFMIIMKLTNNAYYKKDNPQLKEIFNQFTLERTSADDVMAGGTRRYIVTIEVLTTLAVFCFCIKYIQLGVMKSHPFGEDIRSFMPNGVCFARTKILVKAGMVTIEPLAQPVGRLVGGGVNNMLSFAAYVFDQDFTPVNSDEMIDSLLKYLKTFVTFTWTEAFNSTVMASVYEVAHYAREIQTCNSRLDRLQFLTSSAIGFQIFWRTMMQIFAPATTRLERVKMALTGGPVYTVAALSGKMVSIALHTVHTCVSAVGSIGARADASFESAPQFYTPTTIGRSAEYYTPKTLTRNGGRRNKRKTKMKKNKCI